MNPAAIHPMLYPDTELDKPAPIHVLKFPNPWLRFLATLGLAATLAACGGGDITAAEKQAFANEQAELQAQANLADSLSKRNQAGATKDSQAVFVGSFDAPKKKPTAVFVGSFD